jgi:hypothetical protein
MTIEFSNIETLLEQLSPNIHLENISWIEPIGIGILKLYNVANPEVQISLSGRDSAVSYCNTILNGSLSLCNTYTPFIPFNNEIDVISDDITHKIISNANNLSSDNKDDLSKYLKYLIREMMSNVVSHANSQIGGFITAQYYPQKNKVQVIIIDNGIGLQASLSQNYHLNNEEDAIQKAMEKEVTGSNPFASYNNVQKHAGLGLFFLSKIIENTQGNLLIVSNNTIYKSPQNSFQELNTNFKGTLIAFEIFEDNLEYEFMQLFNIIKSEDEEDEEDAFD